MDQETPYEATNLKRTVLGCTKLLVLAGAASAIVLVPPSILGWLMFVGDRAERTLAIVYTLPLLVGLGILLPAVKRYYRLSEGEKTSRLDAFKERLRSYNDNTGILASAALHLLSFVNLLLAGPVVLLFVALIGRFKWKRLAFTEIIPIWSILLITFSYWLASAGDFRVSIILCAAIVAGSLSAVLSPFKRKEGLLDLLSAQQSQLSPARVLITAFVLATAFAGLHFDISHQNSHAYSASLTIIDSLYFSLVTFATVGYGDIAPMLPATRLLCSAEIIIGVVTLVLALNATMTVWLQKHQQGLDAAKAPQALPPERGETAAPDSEI